MLPKRIRKLWVKLQALILKSFIEKDSVIVRFDGGISSQIAFWALYLEFEKRGESVKADLSWYLDDGMDMFKQHVRNFDMEKAFPSVKLRVAKPYEAYFYQRKHFVTEEAFRKDLSGPVYLGGYYDRWSLFKKYASEITQAFEPELPVTSAFTQVYNAITEVPEKSCAVHVRRGDLAVFNPFYGEPLTPEYFIRAVKKIADLYPGTTFFFFSDDHPWVEKELLPVLSDEARCILVDINDSSKGYLDLYLMSRCGNFVASQGSLAKYARLLGDPERTIIEPASARLFDDSDTHPSIMM